MCVQDNIESEQAERKDKLKRDNGYSDELARYCFIQYKLSGEMVIDFSSD